MALHRLTTITLGVPDVATAAAFYRDFGLAETGTGSLATPDGGEQLRLVAAARRGLVELGLGAENPDDLGRIAAALARLDVAAQMDGPTLRTREPVTGLTIKITVAPRIQATRTEPTSRNAPGRSERLNRPADGVLRSAAVRPGKLSHVAMASPDHEATVRFFTRGLGFAVSDGLPFVSFMRCSEDHHNVAVQQGPGSFLHHTAWEVADVDEVGRGAAAMLAADPTRHVWGLGRHAIGSNFFWYLCDPAGNFAEYIADLDRITDEAAYAPPAWAGAQMVRAWAPPIPEEFLAPKDLATLLG
ncbi:MAG TPA: VOC family protein [Candidatus Eisenbacteria bacterium]|nr:VOC family protein [Candidatus Eisenbacteria bacterium]